MLLSHVLLVAALALSVYSQLIMKSRALVHSGGEQVTCRLSAIPDRHGNRLACFERRWRDIFGGCLLAAGAAATRTRVCISVHGAVIRVDPSRSEPFPGGAASNAAASRSRVCGCRG